MSETIKHNIVVYRSGADCKDNGRQPFNNQTDRITPFTASSVYNGIISSSEELRFNRKVHQ